MAKRFHELSPKAQTAVFVLLCLLTVIGAWQVLIGPEQAELTARKSKLASVEAEVKRAQATAARLPLVEKEVRDLEASLHATTAVLPDEKDPQDVLRALHQLASESSLAIATFTPKPVVTKAQYSEWPIELGLVGGYHDLGRFFDRVSAMARLISVSDLNIKTKSNPAARGTVTASCLATTFVFKKDAPLPPADVKKTGGQQ
jgi:type IV pilus assembly protein PilO